MEGSIGEKKVSYREMVERTKSPAFPVKCPHCGSVVEIHAPRICKTIEFWGSSIMFTPSFSMNERVCPGCGIGFAPTLEVIPPIVWVTIEVPEVLRQPEPERSSIIIPKLNFDPSKLTRRP